MKRKINNRKLKLGAVSLTVTMLTLAAVIIFNVAFTALAYKFSLYTRMSNDPTYDVTDACIDYIENTVIKKIPDGDSVTRYFCDDAEVIRQVEEDRLHLSELAGYEVVGMAYPCGGVNNDDRVAKLIKENTGVKYSRTITTTNSFEPQDNLFRFNPSVYHLNFDDMMRLGREFVELNTETPKIFYIWGHSYEMDIGADFWLRLEAFFELISNKDDIFYGTNKEILL